MKAIILLLSCIVSLSLTAQDKNAKWEKYTPMMTKSIGVSFMKFDNLNSRMANFPQYGSLRREVWTLSLGSMHNMKNFVSQMTITAGGNRSGDRDARSSSLRILSGGVDLGYDVIPSDMVMVYPLVGLGAETDHAIFRKDATAVDFDAVANSPTTQNNIRSLKFVNTFFTYRLGLGLGFKSPKGYGTIGIQAGYVGGFTETGWKSAEYQQLNNAPSDKLHRFSISLLLGGGGMVKGMMKK
jgi:hypothetical protein